MNTFHPKKLLNSKWTAVKPINKEKHFLIIKVKFDDQQHVVECLIQAIMSKRFTQINWKDLKNKEMWLQGWQ